jgi:predicted nucleic acid-binding protein
MPSAATREAPLPTAPAPKVVIDPFSVCMGLVYGDPQARLLLDLCREGRCIPLVSDDTVRELCRALSSPFFAHAPLSRRKSMLRDFVRIARRLGVRRAMRTRPPLGMASVLLAMAGQAQVLITSTPEQVPQAPGMSFRVMSPAAFLSEWIPEQLFLRRPTPLH